MAQKTSPVVVGKVGEDDNLWRFVFDHLGKKPDAADVLNEAKETLGPMLVDILEALIDRETTNELYSDMKGVWAPREALEDVGSILNDTCIGYPDLDVFVVINQQPITIHADGRSWSNGSLITLQQGVAVARIFKDAIEQLALAPLPIGCKLVVHEIASKHKVMCSMTYESGTRKVDIDLVPVLAGVGKVRYFINPDTGELIEGQYSAATVLLKGLDMRRKGEVNGIIKVLKFILHACHPALPGKATLTSCALEAATMEIARDYIWWNDDHHGFVDKFRAALGILRAAVTSDHPSLAPPARPRGETLYPFQGNEQAQQGLARWIDILTGLSPAELVELVNDILNKVRCLLIGWAVTPLSKLTLTMAFAASHHCPWTGVC
jgi:hypothetical protein